MTDKLSTPILTPRLLIRLVERDDLEALFAMHTDTGTTRYIPHMRWLASGELQEINLFGLLKREWQSAPAT